MKAEMRDKIILETENCFKLAGAKNYDDGLQTFGKLLNFFQRVYDPMRTKERLIVLLDQMPEPNWKERLFIHGGFKYLPHVLRYGIKEMSKAAEETLPAIPVGRPGLDLQTREKIIAHVGQKFTKGFTLEQAKKSGALHFGVSDSTVQRTWDDRGNMGETDFRSVLKFISEIEKLD